MEQLFSSFPYRNTYVRHPMFCWNTLAQRCSCGCSSKVFTCTMWSHWPCFRNAFHIDCTRFLAGWHRFSWPSSGRRQRPTTNTDSSKSTVNTYRLIKSNIISWGSHAGGDTASRHTTGSSRDRGLAWLCSTFVFYSTSFGFWSSNCAKRNPVSWNRCEKQCGQQSCCCRCSGSPTC